MGMFQFDEMERVKSKAETMVTPLRAKNIRLAQKCRNKVSITSIMSKNKYFHFNKNSSI